MPTTYNGIGTHYYGKKNIEVRRGACQSCNVIGELKSYDTRLWFVLLFIPIIPLGRKRILESCPSCTRHRVIDLNKWQGARRESISGAVEKYRSDPTPENAIAAHQSLIDFQELKQAAEFRKSLEEKFSNNERVQIHFGEVLEHLGKPEEAAQYFERALQLRPELPEARSGVGVARIRQGRLEEARLLLEHLVKPGAVELYSLEPLELLANAYQKAGQHAQALELYAKLLEAIPDLTQHTEFRKRVRTSEKAAGKSTSALPKKKFNWARFLGREASGGKPEPAITRKGLMAFAAIAILIGLILVGVNENIRRSRPVFLVNTTGKPVVIKIPGHGEHRLASGIKEIELPEGHHRVEVTGPEPQLLDLHIGSRGYFSRFSDKPVWIINVAGASMFVFQDAEYAEKDPREAVIRIIYGDPVIMVPHVTHPFKPLPEAVKLKRNAKRNLTSINLQDRSEPAAVFSYLSKVQKQEALPFAEWILRRDPDQRDLLFLYAREGSIQNQQSRAQAFLHSGLTNRPVLVEWHRAFQELPGAAHQARLIPLYDSMLAGDPSSGELAYLRGRIATNRAEARHFYTRSRELTPESPYPFYALAYQHMSSGEWSEALTLSAEAIRLTRGDDQFRHTHTLAQMALRRFSEVELSLKEHLNREPVSIWATLSLAQNYLWQGRTNDAAEVIAEFGKRLARKGDSRAGGAELAQTMQRQFLYMAARFRDLEMDCMKDKSPGGMVYMFHALLEQGRMNEAEKFAHTLEETSDPFDLLAPALAWRLAGDAARAEAWEQRISAALAEGDRDRTRAAELLRRREPVGVDELAEIVTRPESKSALAALLAFKHPAHAKELRALARKLNVDLSFPHYLIERASSPAL